MHTDLLEQFGLAKNEAIIYETLLKHGESNIADICRHTQIHRRNVYDSLRRLIEKGVTFEILSGREHRYKAVNPNKFMEFIQEKEARLKAAMPHLQALYDTQPHKDEVCIYRGPEGWKNYMQDIICVGQPVYFIGAKGCWLDERVKHFFPLFEQEIKKQQIPFYHLFDAEVVTECPEILPYVGENYKFLPKAFSTTCGIDIFGDHVNILSNMRMGGFEDEFSFTVIVNPQIANAFRTWFQFMWDSCPEATKQP